MRGADVPTKPAAIRSIRTIATAAAINSPVPAASVHAIDA
jgi:hypothetical protein